MPDGGNIFRKIYNAANSTVNAAVIKAVLFDLKNFNRIVYTFSLQFFIKLFYLTSDILNIAFFKFVEHWQP